MYRYRVDFDFNAHTYRCPRQWVLSFFNLNISIYICVCMFNWIVRHTKEQGRIRVLNDSEIEADQARTGRLIIPVLSSPLSWEEKRNIIIITSTTTTACHTSWYMFLFCLSLILEEKHQKKDIHLPSFFFREINKEEEHATISGVCFRVKI